MRRGRVRVYRPIWGVLTQAITVVLGLTLIYGGALLAMLAFKVSPHTIERLSDYQKIYHKAAALNAGDFSTHVRLIVGFAGLLTFLVFAFLTLQALPRPYLARTETAEAVTLPEAERGTTAVHRQAVERIAELAARSDANVRSADGRLGDGELFLDVGVSGARHARATLSEVRKRVREQFAFHDFPPMPVNVTMTDYDRSTERATS